MKLFKRICLSIFSLFLVVFSFAGCSGGLSKELTVEDVDKEIETVESKINNGFDYVELTTYNYNSNGDKIGKELVIIHNNKNSESKEVFTTIYNAVYEIEKIEKETPTGSKTYETNENLTRQSILKQEKDSEGKLYWMLSEKKFECNSETGKWEPQPLVQEKLEDVAGNETLAGTYAYMYKELLPTEGYELVKGEKGPLNTIIEFKPVSESIAQISLKINNATDKIHSATMIYEDLTKVEKSFNYPIAGFKKFEIPSLA